jgi:tryptophanyl-tRNA synthetase
MKKRILTGDRPTGKLHLGHYLGSLANRVRLQDEYDLCVLVADYHTLTTKPEESHQIEGHIRSAVLDYLAVGIDPEISHIYIQSQVPQTAVLQLLFSMFTQVPRLERIPTLKEILRVLKIPDASLGLLGYPVLQSADILIVRANLVPVGKDQESHIELTREIARRFNGLYDRDVFPEAAALIGEVPTLVGTDGQEKMSKSLDNCIYLSDPPEEVQRRVMGMYTDPTRLRATDPGHVEGNPTFAYHDAFNDNKDEVADLKERYVAGRVGDVEVKKKLAAAINRFLDPMRERRAQFEQRPRMVQEILAAGGEYARRIGQETIEMALEAMGMNYPNLR